MKRVVATAGALFLASSAASANAEELFSTSYESPTYTPGPLSGQDGWVNSFDIDPVVTSVFAKTGSQSLEVRRTPLDNPFGLTFRVGPYITSQPKIAVQHSVYLAGNNSWAGTFVSPLALIGENGFIAQLPIRNGLNAEVFDASAAIETDKWIDLRLTLDFQSQTAEAFVDGESIGSGAFQNPATELVHVEIFHIFGFSEGNFSPFYVDDLIITAVPEPGSLALLVAGALCLLRRRRE